MAFKSIVLSAVLAAALAAPAFAKNDKAPATPETASRPMPATPAIRAADRTARPTASPRLRRPARFWPAFC